MFSNYPSGVSDDDFMGESPEDRFTYEELAEWALENGFVLSEDIES